MKISRKFLTAGIAAALTLSVAASAFAAGLTVKTKKSTKDRSRQPLLSLPVLSAAQRWTRC